MAAPAFSSASGRPLALLQAFVDRVRIRLLFNRRRQIEFLETLVAFDQDGVPIPQTISFIAETSVGAYKALATYIETQFHRGRSLSDGLARHYPAYIAEGIRAGEVGGSLSSTLVVVLEHLREASGLGSDFAKQMIYPTALVLFICSLLAFMHGEFFAPVASGKDMAVLPDIFVFYHAFSGWLVVYGLLLPVGVAVLVGGGWLALTRLHGRLRDLLDGYPAFKQYRMVAAARLMTDMGTLMRSGMPFRNAVRILRASEGPYLAMHLDRTLSRLARGMEVGPALDTGLLDRTELLHLQLLSRSSQFDRALVSCGKRLVEVVKGRLAAVAASIKYVVMAAVALLGVGFYITVMNIGAVIG